MPRLPPAPFANDRVVLRQIGEQRWRLEASVTFVTPGHLKINPPRVSVHRGFETDLASIPQFFWNVLPPFGTYTAAAIVHDFLYDIQRTTRGQADGAFLAAMQSLGVGWWRRHGMWFAVRLFGWFAWRGRKVKPADD